MISLHSPVILGEDMESSILPTDSKLYKILEKCEITHDITLLEAHDGALFFICTDCPFKQILDDKEETIIRARMATNPY